jgi:hypothetical protein
MAWYVLDNGMHTARRQTMANRATYFSDNLGIMTQRAIADDIVGTPYRNVEHGCAIHRYPQLEQIRRYQPSVEARGPACGAHISPGKLGKGVCGRRCPPLRRSQACDAPTLLVDQNGSVGPDSLKRIN